MIYDIISKTASDNYYYLNNYQTISSNDSIYEISLGFHLRDIEQMKDRFVENYILPIERHSFISFEEYVNSNNKCLYKGEVNGLVEINNDILNSFGFELVDGHLPTDFDESYVQVAISKFLFEYFKEYGIRDFKVSNYEDIRYKSFSYHDIQYIITGVIDTKNDVEYFSSYLLYENTQFNKQKLAEYQEIVENEIHTFLFVPETYLTYHLSGFSDALRIKLHNTRSIFYNGKVLSFNYVSYNLNNINIIWEYHEKTELNNREVIIDVSMLNQTLVNMRIEELINSYAQNNYHSIREVFQKDYPNADYVTYVNYILTNEINAYDHEKSYSSFQTIVLQEYIENINNGNPDITIKTDLADLNFEVKVVGISLNNVDTVILSTNDYLLVENSTVGPFSSVLVKSSNNYKKDANIIKPYVNNIENIKNHKLHTYYNFIKTYDSARIYVLILTGLFSFMTVILLFYYISDIISNETKNISLFVALGTSKKDITYIYLMFIFIVQLISLLFGILMYYVLTTIINVWFTIKFNLYIAIFRFSTSSFIYSLCLLLGFYFIFTFILLIRILSNKSVKTLYYR